MLLFRRNSFYELYKQDAVKAAAVLAIEITDRMLPDYKRPVKVASFPQSALDVICQTDTFRNQGGNL